MSRVFPCSPRGPAQTPGRPQAVGCKIKGHGQDCILARRWQVGRLLLLLLSSDIQRRLLENPSELVEGTQPGWPDPPREEGGQRGALERGGPQGTQGHLSWRMDPSAVLMRLLLVVSSLQTPESTRRNLRKCLFGFQGYFLSSKSLEG